MIDLGAALKFAGKAGALALVCAAHAEESSIERVPFAERSIREGDTLFTTVPRDWSALTDRNDYDDPAMWGSKFLEFTLGALGTGVAVGDFDGDGWPDLFVASKTQSDRLFRNLGDFRFEDVTERAGVGGEAGVWTQGAAFADVDNDGLLDIYLCRYGAPNFLYLNNGDGTFTEGADRAGVAVASASGMASFADYDNDGDLDFYLVTNLLSLQTGPSGEPDRLFRNRGDGRFDDVTEQAGIAGEGQGHSATWIDADQDGRLDLYVANDFTPADKLYHNLGDGRFVDTLGYAFPHTPNSSMGADFADLNGDGLMDLLVADMAATRHEKDMRGMVNGREEATDPVSNPFAAQQYPRNAVYINSGLGSFYEGAFAMGLDATDWTWSPRFEDLDNDGRVDLHVTTGMIRELHNTDLMRKVRAARSPAQRIAIVKSSPRFDEANLAYRNLGDYRFVEVGKEWGLNEIGVSFGVAFGDFDRDGDLDLVSSNYQKGVTLLRNDSASGERLIFELEGVESNRFGIGATVTVETKEGTQTKSLSLSRGYASTSEPIVHFGLGESAMALRTVIRWPSGIVQTLPALESGARYRIRESGTKESPRSVEVGNPLYEESSRELNLLHRVRERFVFERKEQPFLPRRHNRVGPALAVGDVDGDGRDDLVVGGTPSDPLTIFRNSGDGTFDAGRALRLEDSKLNDGAILLFDADGDGRKDLLVAKGGVAEPAGSAAYQPRLFLNDGAGGFDDSRLYPMPGFPVSVAAAAAADYDRDGDLDLFLGGRVEPGSFPESPRSGLLRNDGSGFVDASPLLPSEDGRLGMASDALWSDVDRDGWPDLLVATKWGPVRFFRNKGGDGFEDLSEEWGFASAGSGAWNSIAAADFNSDGRLDYALGNKGLNTPYEASPEFPATLFYGAFEPGGKKHLIEAKYENGRLVPARTWDILKKRVPGLAERYSGNDAFAKASLSEAVGEAFLQTARRFEMTELRSGVLLSQEGGGFRFAPFPALAQFAPLQGLAAGDFDGDGFEDVYAVQNDFSPIPSVGRYDGGLSQLMLGDGAGGFTALLPAKSGLLATGDGRALCVADFDDDAAPDFLLSRNHSSVLAYRNVGSGRVRFLRVTLEGPSGNPSGAGALLELEGSDGWTRIRETQLGGGGLGQSSRHAFFGLSESADAYELIVYWPDGYRSNVKIDPDERVVTVRREAE